MAEINVVLILDSKYVIGAAAAGRSIIDRAAEAQRVWITVLCNGVASADRAALRASWGDDSRIDFIDIDLAPFAKLRTGGFTTTLYARLAFDQYLPEQWDRFISLDCDMICLTCLAPLMSLNLEGNVLAATIEPWGPTISSDNTLPGWEQLGLPASTPYFNSGLMVIDRAAWRSRDIEGAAARHAFKVGSLLKMYEQECLNVAVRGSWLQLDPEWNVTPYWWKRERRAGRFATIWEDARIRHFQGKAKPWVHRWRCTPASSEFYDSLDRTAWRGWRPTALASSDTADGRG